MASTTAPRPILKSSSRKSSTSSTSSCDSIPSSSRGPCVQFSACLSTTYLTHASTDYNRCPIDVTPNTLAMPKRGCPGRTYRDEQTAALAQFRMEAEGRSMPALVSDDGFSSSEESDASIPSPTAYTPSFNIPPSLLKSSRSNGSRRPKPASRSYGYDSSYSISTAPCYDARDDIFGGF